MPQCELRAESEITSRCCWGARTRALFSLQGNAAVNADRYLAPVHRRSGKETNSSSVLWLIVDKMILIRACSS